MNSLALLAARAVSEASNVLAIMGATYLYALCQALDLRSLHLEFAAAAETKVIALLETIFALILQEAGSRVEDLHVELWPVILEAWLHSSSLDLDARGSATAKRVSGCLVTLLQSELTNKILETTTLFGKICLFQAQLSTALVSAYTDVRTAFLKRTTTTDYLSFASGVIYKLIRKDLGIPLHRGVVDYPTINAEDLPANLESGNFSGSPVERVTIGTHISKIYEILQSKAAHDAVIEIVGEIENQRKGEYLNT